MNLLKEIIEYLSKLFTWWVVIMPWEQGIRVTLGRMTKTIEKGIFLKIPLVHTVYVQEKRLRVINLPIQTITTKDGKPCTISCSVGYSINDINELYNTLYQPDMTISNIVAGKIAEEIFNTPSEECNPATIENHLNLHLSQLKYGLKFDYVRIINFASVKTFRLIQDQTYMYEGLDLIKTK